MKCYAIWNNHKVIGYCYMSEETKETLNGIEDSKLYFGFDKVLCPEKYTEETESIKETLTEKYKRNIKTLLDNPNVLKYEISDMSQKLSTDFQAHKISFDDFTELYNMLPWYN